jgi:hypothetical protein
VPPKKEKRKAIEPRPGELIQLCWDYENEEQIETRLVVAVDENGVLALQLDEDKDFDYLEGWELYLNWRILMRLPELEA